MTPNIGLLGLLGGALNLRGGAGLLGALVLPRINYTAILPELILIGGALLLLGIGSLFRDELPTAAYAGLAVGLSVASLVVSLVLYHDVTARQAFTTIDHSVSVDGFGAFVAVLVSAILLVASLAAVAFLERERIVGPEYYALALLSGGGAILMGSANDLLIVFLGLEILSLPLYVLAGLDQRRSASGEAALKYFLLGAFSSAIFVYGIALTYGATGSTNLTEIGDYLAHNVLTSNGVLLAGLALLLVGFAFKIAAVPFHFWTPDVYQGAPTPATGFMAAMAKVGGFVGFLRVFLTAFPSLRDDWQPIIYVLAILTLILGATFALVQDNIKRVLAYSAINHAGFVLLGLEAFSLLGVEGSLYYVFAYAFLTLGTFAIVALVAGKGDSGHTLAAYRGLARRQPLLGLSLAVLLLAQAGAPFTTGFFAKLLVVEAVVDAHSYPLAVVAMLSAAVAAFFYLRIVLYLYSVPASGALRSEPESEAPAEDRLGVGAGDGVDVPAGEVGRGEGSTAEWLSSPGTTGPLRQPGETVQVVGAHARAGGLLVAERESERGEASDVALKEPERIVVPLATAAVIGVCVGVTIVFGIWPAPLIDFAHAARLLFF